MRAPRITYGLLALFLLLVVAPAAAAFKYVEVGDQAPSFSLKTLAGETISLEETLGAKALVVVFWATWSPRSQPLLDDLETLYRQRKDQGFAILAINVEHEEIGPEDRAAIQAMASRWSFPVLLDEGLTAYYAYGVVATPSLALVDDQGVTRYVRASHSTAAREDNREAIDALLGLEEEKAARIEIAKRDYVPPKKATLHYQKARVLMERGMAKRAIRDLEQASEIDPNWADPRVVLAGIYRSEGRNKPRMLQKAETVLREAREIQPRHLLTLASLAEVLADLEKYDEALETVGQALALEPAYTPSLLAKARSLRALGRLDEASAVLEEAQSLNPRDPHVFLEKGELEATQGRWEEAAGSLRKAVELAVAASGRKG